ncbi:MAG: alpha-galactosidase [Verrucomicrobiae bacterium]|nr:alpha-galactosidase [Verrucomicrobiae bacterium]
MSAQQDGGSLIQVDEKNRRFLLQIGGGTYAFQVNLEGFLTHLHWGGRVDRMEDLPAPEDVICYRHRHARRSEVARQEYPGWGGEFYGEPALKADFPDGARCALLKYKDFSLQKKCDEKELIVTLKDTGYPLEVRLHYRIYSDTGIVERWSEIDNGGKGTVVLRSALSACWHLPRVDCDYRLSHLAGRWGGEGMINRLPVTQSKIVLENRTGMSGPFAMPFFALDEGGHATEHSGRVWFGSLHWSGNWKMAVERDGYEQVSVCGGIHDFDFSWPLKSGETFKTPVFCGGVSEAGFGGASRMLHDYERRRILPPETRRKPMPLIFNSWASMGIHVNEWKILGLAEKAAAFGAELFVIDDGWQMALGDWQVDRNKFPNGLTPVIKRVKELGMDFGLWVEIESCETNSRLYREHPEWMMTFPGREVYLNTCGDRVSVLLNFARDDVAEHFYQALRGLLRETGIRYLKLDKNYTFVDPGWGEALPEERQTIWIKYVRNLHGIFERLNREFPEVLMENCAGGSSRSDLAMNRYFGRINRSDNQDALDVLRLHEGFTWMHPTRMAGGGCHISKSVNGVNLRRLPMKFQAYVGLMCSLSVGKNLTTCSAEELSEIRSYADLYKRLRHIPQFGDLYRLASHYEHPYAAFEFVTAEKKEALLFVLGHSIQFARKISNFRMMGLDPEAVYEIECFGNNPDPVGYTASVMEYSPVSGRGLMEMGVRVELLGDYDVRILYFKSSMSSFR